MHVVLTILKIIGIILLVILAILLLLLLVMLFVPLRYRLHARKEMKRDPEADGTMTWLLHMLRADISYRDGEGIAVIRVFGFRLKTLRFAGKEKEPERAPVEAAQEETAPETAASEAEAQIKTKRESILSEPEKAEFGKEESAAKKAAEEDFVDSKSAKATASAKTKKTEPEEKEEKTSAGKADSGKREKPLHDGPVARLMKLFAKFMNRALDLLLQVPGLPVEIHDRIDIIQQKICKKYDLVRKKAEPFLSIEAEHMFRKGIGYLKYLIRGYAPRKITGYLHFGTGAPDLTGWLTGVVYMLLPESGTEYDVEPDFYEAVLNTDTEVRGHIRAYRLAWVGLRLLFDKEFRILFARIRGKERTQAHRGSRRARRKAMEEAGKKAA